MLAFVLGCAAVICALYGATVFMVGSGTWFFAMWFVLAAAFLAAALVAHAGVWAAVPLVLRRAVQVAAAIVVAVLVVTQACAISAFGAQGEDDLDYIIVLGAQVHETGPSYVLKYRLDAACDYLRENPHTVCIVSGGQGPNEPVPEAHVMADYLEAQGIDPSRILQEDQSLTTYQNIRNCMRLLDAREAGLAGRARVGVVTNDFHVFRGVHIARKQGMANACGIAAKSTLWFVPNNLLRESFGITKDFLKGNL